MNPGRRFDVAVVGAGAAGLAAAIALAREGFEVALVGRHGPVPDGRTVALLDGSVRFLEALGVWAGLENAAAPLAELHLVDDSGSLFRPPPARFRATEIGLTAFGWNVENTRLVAHLRSAAASSPNLTLFESDARETRQEPDQATILLEEGEPIGARLVVGADGARSSLRKAAGLAVREWTYPQAAVTTLLAHERPHRDISTEFHTRGGPFTLVPLPGGQRSSLVWVARQEQAERLAALDDAALGEAVARRAHFMLGAMRVDGPRGLVPMRGLTVDRPVAARLALIGEAAHVFPPIGAQGLNLGFRDAAALRDTLVAARDAEDDPGSEAVLARFARGRIRDARFRSRAVDWLNRSLLADLLPVDALRGLGLLAIATIGPIRRAAMREGLLPRFGTPRLMSGRRSETAG